MNIIKIKCLIVSILLLASLGVEAKRITLPMNVTDGKCVLKQSMFNKKADVYVVRNCYDLMGNTITIPEDAVLLFKESGCLEHGTVIGQNSSIKTKSNKRLFKDVSIVGQWDVKEVYSVWFDFSDDAKVNTRNFQNMCSLTDNQHHGVLHISEGDYEVEVTSGNISCIKPNSNTDIILEGNILLQPNDLGTYNIIDISNKHNVSLSGGGTIVGDVIRHNGNDGEWGMGVNITTSTDIVLKDLTIKNCWGDCIYIGQTRISEDEYSKNVRIVNVTCQAGRRQGLSLIAGKNINIKGCRFIDTGKIKYTSPGRGVDIEPNDKDKTIVQDIIIEDCYFSGNYGNNDLLTYNLNKRSSVRVVRCKMDGRVSLYQNSYNVVVDSCEVHSLDFVDSVISDNVIRNTIFKSLKPNISEPHKVRFENCEYPKEETSALMNWVVPTFLFSGMCMVSLIRWRINRA